MTAQHQQNVMGLSGMVWFFGVVEDRQDPLQVGRVRIRIYFWHKESRTFLPTENLPWATIGLPTTVAAPLAPKEGDTVWGFFLDGENAQQPMILAICPGFLQKNNNEKDKGFRDVRTSDQLQNSPRKPNTDPQLNPINPDQSSLPLSTRQADTDTQNKDKTTGVTTSLNTTWDEPDSPAKPQYPYNKVIETESGHLMELDDTSGAERTNIKHRIGTFTETGPDGTQVTRIVKDNYQIVAGDEYLYVKGKCNMTVLGDVNIRVENGDATVGIDKGSCFLVAKEKIYLQANVEIDITAPVVAIF